MTYSIWTRVVVKKRIPMKNGHMREINELAERPYRGGYVKSQTAEAHAQVLQVRYGHVFFVKHDGGSIESDPEELAREKEKEAEHGRSV